MNISLLQFIISLTWIVFFFFWIDLYKRRKANLLHFLVFFGWGIIVTFFISLLNSHTKNNQQLTKLTSHLACDKAWETQWKSVLSFVENEKKSENSKKLDKKTSNLDFLLHIRCYNEAKTIWNVIDDVIKNWYNKILILNDGSTDNTLQIIKKKQKQYSDSIIVVVSHAINRWPWAINQTGFEFCKRHWEKFNIKRVVMFDADEQMNIKDMQNFIENIDKQKEIEAWFGSRFMGIKSEKMPFFRKIVLKIWKIVSFLLYKNKIEDYHCWFRVIKLDAVKKIKLTADGFHYANELIDEINRWWIKAKEIPVHIKYTEYSLSKWQKSSNAFKMWFEMIYKKFFFR